MCAAVSPKRFRTALVLGGGGAVGLSWLAGLVSGLDAAGVDLRVADRFVGTSAGAVVAAVLAGDGDLGRLLRPASDRAPAVSPRVSFAQMFAPLREPALDLAQARRKVGELALAAEAGDPGDHVARMAALIGTSQWPPRDLVVTAVDITTGARQGWTRDGAASLAQALASSTSVPGVFPPIPIQGRHYIDGGIGSPINADLAAGAEVIVIVEPLAHMFSHLPADSELGEATTVSLVPDTEAIAAIGADVFNPAALAPAYAAGVRQSADAATLLKSHGWPAR
ncbi:patatin-like phospholipase family protein [Nocardia transvalensis]|uniref:patatin-like phospholipase family protein n=1 Tax=Nocardia transvalensis TaxID=37333 RepID=UPI0018930B41|nr:patatin-like phospholipase family protein [Nocardia transvalensis]MBF6328397.1 patatin-like phospholipase family protein [Nocardia transvalensis]